MTLERRARRNQAPALEFFESRVVPSTSPTSVTVPLDPMADQFGAQIETVQAYEDAAGMRVTFGIFDTGSSVVSFSADDQATFDYSGMALPVLVPGGAQADGIGGSITGDVAQPATIWADGIHAANVTLDDFGFPLVDISFGNDAAVAPGVQAFIGTPDGSPDLPTVTGTPVLNGTLSAGGTSSPGVAALVDMQGYKIDLSDLFPGLVLAEPDLHFVAPGTTLPAATPGDTAPVTIPLTLVGDDNHTGPGDQITATQNPTVPGVTLVGAAGMVSQQSFLFDTGSQLTILSTAEATALGLDLAHPDSTLPVQGVGGVVEVPGFTLPELDVPTSDGGLIRFTDAPVYVLDAAPGVVDGILGMNLFNSADQILYDPFSQAGPTLSVTFMTGSSAGTGSSILVVGPGLSAPGSARAQPLLARGSDTPLTPQVSTIGVPSGAGAGVTIIGVPTSPPAAPASPAAGTTGSPGSITAAIAVPAAPGATTALVRPPQSSELPHVVASEPAPLSGPERDLWSEPAEAPAMSAPLDVPLAVAIGPGAGIPRPGGLAGDPPDASIVDKGLISLMADSVLTSLSELVEDAGPATLPAGALFGLTALLGGSLSSSPTFDASRAPRRRSRSFPAVPHGPVPASAGQDGELLY
jgi:hypothetical protein